jgi:hypothetical protein
MFLVLKAVITFIYRVFGVKGRASDLTFVRLGKGGN